MPYTPIIALMAADPNGVIGKENRLPWDYPEELEAFRATTLGQVCIMGRKTFDGIPEIFHTKRDSIVLTTCSNFKNDFATAARGIGESIRLAQELAGPQNKSIFMIGGAELAHTFLDEGHIDAFHLTQIKHQHKGDITLDISRLKDWHKESILQETNDFKTLRLLPPKAHL